MALSAQAHQIFDRVFIFAATHTPPKNMMQVNPDSITDLTEEYIVEDIVKVVIVYLCVLFHFQPFFILS